MPIKKKQFGIVNESLEPTPPPGAQVFGVSTKRQRCHPFLILKQREYRYDRQAGGKKYSDKFSIMNWFSYIHTFGKMLYLADKDKLIIHPLPSPIKSIHTSSYFFSLLLYRGQIPPPGVVRVCEV